MNTAYKAAPTSKKAIADYARTIRRNMGLEQTFYFPVMEFLEVVLQEVFPDMTLEIVAPEDMPFKEGETIPGQNKIRIREDVYNAACDGNGRARFTVAHEIGHFFFIPRMQSRCAVWKRGRSFGHLKNQNGRPTLLPVNCWHRPT